MIDVSFWKSRPVLVTGPAGFLGSRLVRELTILGANVVAVFHQQKAANGSPGLANQARLVSVFGDIADRPWLMETMRQYSIDTVFHLAGQSIVGQAYQDPAGTFSLNALGTVNVLEAARHANVARVIVASTASVYGTSNQLPHREDEVDSARYPYDVSKKCAELATRCFAQTYGLSTIIARCANLFGGGDTNFSRVIPGVIRSTMLGESFHIRGDGCSVRDYLYIQDAILAYLVLAQSLARDPTLAGEIFNFSLEVRMPVLQLVNEILELMDRTDLKPVVLNETVPEICESYLSCEKARVRLGWKPEHSLQSGLRKTIRWYADFFDQQLVASEHQQG